MLLLHSIEECTTIMTTSESIYYIDADNEIQDDRGSNRLGIRCSAALSLIRTMRRSGQKGEWTKGQAGWYWRKKIEMLCVEKIPCHEDVPRLQFLVSSPQRFSYSSLNSGLTSIN